MNKFLKIFVAVLVTSIIILPSANASTLSREEIQLEEQKIFLDSVDNYTDYL